MIFEVYSQLFVCVCMYSFTFEHAFEHSLEPAVFPPNGRSGSKRSTSPTTCQFRQQHHGTKQQQQQQQQQQQSKYNCGPGKSRATVRHGFYFRSSFGSAACVQQRREQSMQSFVGDVESVGVVHFFWSWRNRKFIFF
jgi:hypothetical protein